MNGNPPKVSIILVAGEDSENIKQSIDSCLSQTYKNIELIVVGDGSTDERSRLLKSYNDNRMRYIRLGKPWELPVALNTGLANAVGECVTWTRDKGQYLPTAIEEMASFLAINKGVDFVYADYWACHRETDEKELRIVPDQLNLAKKNEVGPCFLYTRRVQEVVGAYDSKYRLVEDYDYWIRLCKRFKAKRYPRALYVYNEQTESWKSADHIDMMLKEAVLKYENRYASLSDFQKSFVRPFYEGSEISTPRKLLAYFQSIAQIFQISNRLGAFSLILTARMLLTMILTFFAQLFVIVPLRYSEFYFSFKRTFPRIKPNQDKKNVLCVVQHLVIGGAQEVLLNVAKGCQNGKFSFHLIATLPDKNVWRSKFEPYFLNIVTPKHEFEKLYYRYFNHIVEKLNIDIILITNSAIGYKCIPELKSKFPNVKIIDVLHSENFPPIPELETLTDYFDRRICISNKVRNYLAGRYGKLNLSQEYLDRLSVVHNGIDTNEYKANPLLKGAFKAHHSIPDDTKIIAFVGRFAPEKNPLRFVEIAKRLVERKPDAFKFVMTGDGPEFANVRNKISEYGLENHFILTGRTENVTDLLNDASIVLIVSNYDGREGIPLVILEAMAMGVPVVSTDVGAISEAIENNLNGILVDFSSDVAESFASKIEGLLGDEASYQAMATRAMNTITQRFTLKEMSSSYEEVFNKVTAGNNI